MCPILKTERLILRPLTLDDFNSYVDFWQNSDVVRFITGAPIPREQSWRRLLGTAGHWQLLGFGFFALEDRATGQFIGEAGFQEMRRDLQPSIEGTLETGWGLLPAFQGRGYATEGLRAAMTWAAEAHPDMDYSCITSPENKASLNVARKLGFAESASGSYAGKPVVVLRKPRTGRQ